MLGGGGRGRVSGTWDLPVGSSPQCQEAGETEPWGPAPMITLVGVLPRERGPGRPMSPRLRPRSGPLEPSPRAEARGLQQIPHARAPGAASPRGLRSGSRRHALRVEFSAMRWCPTRHRTRGRGPKFMGRQCSRKPAWPSLGRQTVRGSGRLPGGQARHHVEATDSPSGPRSQGEASCGPRAGQRGHLAQTVRPRLAAWRAARFSARKGCESWLSSADAVLISGSITNRPKPSGSEQ